MKRVLAADRHEARHAGVHAVQADGARGQFQLALAVGAACVCLGRAGQRPRVRVGQRLDGRQTRGGQRD